MRGTTRADRNQLRAVTGDFVELDRRVLAYWRRRSAEDQEGSCSGAPLLSSSTVGVVHKRTHMAAECARIWPM